ncbi:MAG: hypothetical protein N4A39_13355 [Roseicyclus sp.]|nr:hypothetical protein [Roseicyclus sp.]
MRTVLVHFDVEEDYVLLETFVESANAAAKAIEALNDELFSGSIVFELVVFPAAPGSLKQYIGVSVKFVKNSGYAVGVLYAALWSLIQLMDSQTVQDVSQELFGKSPREVLVERIRNFRQRVDSLEPEAEDEAQQLESEGYQLFEQFLVDGASASLSAPPEVLESRKLPPALSYRLRLAQSDLYSAAIDDRNVMGIGFGEGEDFPIQRRDFAPRGVRPLPPREEGEEDLWEVGTALLRVTSPVFKRDQPGRKWMAETSAGSAIHFDIVDNEFWSRVSRRQVTFSEGCEILVQIATKIGSPGRKERKVLRVLKLDGEFLAQPLREDAISAALGNFRFSKSKDPRQESLFDDD